MGCEDSWLVDWDQREAVVYPDQLRVIKMLRQSFSVSGRHQLVLACPNDENRPSTKIPPTERLHK